MLTRRRLLQGSSATVVAMGLPNTAGARPRRQDKGDELRVAVCGIKGRGRNHIDGFRNLDGVRVVALCDADSAILAREVKKFEERGEKVDAEVDFRRLLDRDDIDVMSYATPNHWHALQGVWSCQAGKDVYLEKPVSHNVWEGGQIVKAARTYDRIVQTGTQARSSHGIASAVEWLQEGGLGKIHVARGFCYKPRRSIGKVDGAQAVPATVDYDLWTGPAPLVPLRRKNLHYDWHWVFDTGNGDVGNQGIHQMDLARWALGESALPRATVSVGGRLGYDDDGNTPNTQIVAHDFGEGRAPLVFEVRGLPRDADARKDGWGGGEMDDYHGVKIGVVIEAEGGWLRIPDYNSAVAFDPEGNEIQRWNGSDNHFANFVKAVRSRDTGDLTAEIREGHLSSAMCHMGNVSHVMGQAASNAEVRAALKGDFELDAAERMFDHLDRNGVDLDKTPLSLGPRLAMDPETELFADARARELATRAYRAPFVVPEEV